MSFRVSVTPVEFLELALNSATADPVAALQLAKKREQSIFSEMNQHVQVLTKKHGEEMLKAREHTTAIDIDNMMLQQKNEQLQQQNERLWQENERVW
jgi:hypothetical protein